MTEWTLAVDPGKFAAGVALFQQDVLVKAKLLKASSKDPAEASVEIGALAQAFIGQVPLSALSVHCEMPTVRERKRQKGDPNHLLFLTLVNGAIFTSVGAKKNKLVPLRWKRGIPKEIMRGRLTGDWGKDPPLAPPPRKLQSQEMLVLGPKPNHNVLDAVGIGLWTLDRL